MKKLLTLFACLFSVFADAQVTKTGWLPDNLIFSQTDSYDKRNETATLVNPPQQNKMATVVAGFTIPDTVCINSPVTITCWQHNLHQAINGAWDRRTVPFL